MDIGLTRVTKRFAGRGGEPVTVLDELSLSCASGSVTLLDGRSGSGKSTLLNVIAGLYRPDSGPIFRELSPVDLALFHIERSRPSPPSPGR